MDADPGFAVYVHWPFCTAKCPYCDFNSHVRGSVDQAVWASALCRDLETQAQRVGMRNVHSIFFGGGTPSLMDPVTVDAILNKINDLWPMEADAEITLEANPTSVEADRFAGYRAAGINRVSMGVQSLRDADLKRLGRLHTVAEARAAFAIARREFDRVSFDLIYARQDQTLDSWRSELGEALDMAVDHLSLYQLTIEQGTRFGALHSIGKLRGLPDDTLASDLYELTDEITRAAGMPAYEISNHARTGAQSRHNLVYWRYGTYIGCGPGAHGRIPGPDGLEATAAMRVPERWLEYVGEFGDGIEERRPVPREDQAEEMLIMGLRLTEGISPARFEALSGRGLDDGVIDGLVAEGLMRRNGDRIAATLAGRQVLNHLILTLADSAQ